jgi:hypothetical protein
MAAGLWNFTIEQGEYWTKTLTWKDASLDPIPLTGWHAILTIAREAESTPQLVISDTTTGIVLGGDAGTIAMTIDLTGEDESLPLLTTGNPRYWLNLIAPGGQMRPFFRGRFLVRPDPSA